MGSLQANQAGIPATDNPPAAHATAGPEDTTPAEPPVVGRQQVHEASQQLSETTC